MGIGTIGKYERLDVLGHGTSGVVYLAWDTLLRRQVAIKEIRAAGPELERVLEEARVLDRLGQHPHIVRIHGVDYADGVILIDMELVRGRNLAEVLRERNGTPMPAQEAVRITLDVLDALAYAHERRIIHRDVKPANILMGQDGTVKLTDFGLAEALGTGSVAGGGGTYPYMAPEDFSDDADSDYRSDLWAVGVLLYEMLAGRRPFAVAARTKDPFAWMRVIQKEDPPRLVTLRPDLPTSLDDVLRRALAKDKSARYATARLFSDSLRAAAHALQTSAPLPEPAVSYSAPQPGTSPEPDATGAFIFGNGQTVAYTLDELLAGAAKHWDEARHALIDGRFEYFLRGLGEVYIADLARELAGRTNESADRRLREFLDRSRSDEEPEEGTIPFLFRNAGNGANPGSNGSQRSRRRLLRRVAPSDVPEEPVAAAPPPAPVVPQRPPIFVPATPAPAPPEPPRSRKEEKADRLRKRQEEKQQAADALAAQKQKKAAAAAAQAAQTKGRWWFWPLFLLVVAPPGAALLTRGDMVRSEQGMFSDLLEAWAITGVLSAMLLLVGVGVRVPTPARVACAFPLVTGMVAIGALVFSAIDTTPSPDRLIGVALALLAPIIVLLVQSLTSRALWRMWAWIVFLVAGLATGVYVQ
jgi:serine/threonine protein kinase